MTNYCGDSIGSGRGGWMLGFPRGMLQPLPGQQLAVDSKAVKGMEAKRDNESSGQTVFTLQHL